MIQTHPACEQRLVLLHAKWWQKTTYERSAVNNHLPMQDESTSTQNTSSLGTYSIELRDVTKRFLTPADKVFTAIRDINLAVAPGEFVAVVGPTGSGKSTTLGLISGLEQPSEGSVKVMGKPVQGIDKRFGYVYQADAVILLKTGLRIDDSGH